MEIVIQFIQQIVLEALYLVEILYRIIQFIFIQEIIFITIIHHYLKYIELVLNMIKIIPKLMFMELIIVIYGLAYMVLVKEIHYRKHHRILRLLENYQIRIIGKVVVNCIIFMCIIHQLINIHITKDIHSKLYSLQHLI